MGTLEYWTQSKPIKDRFNDIKCDLLIVGGTQYHCVWKGGKDEGRERTIE
jgi:hypothetical protein